MDILSLKEVSNLELIGDSFILLPHTGKIIIFKDNEQGMDDMNRLKQVMETQSEIIEDRYYSSEDYSDSDDDSDSMRILVDELEKESGRWVTKEIPRKFNISLSGKRNEKDKFYMFFNYLHSDVFIELYEVSVWERELTNFINETDMCTDYTKNLVNNFIELIQEELKESEKGESYIIDVESEYIHS